MHLEFSENIAFGTGNIQIIDLKDGSSTITIDVGDVNNIVGINTKYLYFRLGVDLDSDTNYAVQIPSTAVKKASNAVTFVGIADNKETNPHEYWRLII